jgi:hypothetical protein
MPCDLELIRHVMAAKYRSKPELFFKGFSSYREVNTRRFLYRKQSFNDVYVYAVLDPYKTREFDVHMTVHRGKFLIIKPTRCTEFSNLFLLYYYSTCFRHFHYPSSGVFHCTHSNDILVCHTGLLTACEGDQDVPSWSRSQAVSRSV